MKPRLIGVLAVFAVALSGCSAAARASSAPGVNTAKKTILIGALVPLSGPASVVGDPLSAGVASYLDSVDAGGGVDGWKIYLSARDTRNQGLAGRRAYQQLVGYTLFVGASFGAATTEAIQSAARRGRVLVGLATPDSQFFGSPVDAGVTASVAADTANAVTYAARHVPGARIGIIYQDNASGADALSGYSSALRTGHLVRGAAAAYPPVTAGVTSQVASLKGSGANVVVLSGLPTDTALILATAAADNYHPKWLLVGAAWSEYLMSVSGQPGGAPTQLIRQLAGSWVVDDAAPWGQSTGAPGMAAFLNARATFYPTQPPDPYYLLGYCLGELDVAVLRRAILAHDLSRAAIISDLLRLGTVSFGGLLPAIRYGPTAGPVSRRSRLYRVAANAPGFLHPITGYFTTPAA